MFIALETTVVTLIVQKVIVLFLLLKTSYRRQIETKSSPVKGLLAKKCNIRGLC